jgi:hypothetical protein
VTATRFTEAPRQGGLGWERDHLVVALNDLPQCDFSDLYQFGLTGRGDGYSIINMASSAM